MARPNLKVAQVKLPGGGIGVGAGAVIAGMLLLGAFFWFSMLQEIGPDEVAIKEIRMGPNQGKQEEPIGPGLRFVIPGYERLHVFPRDMQVLDLNSSDNTYAAMHLSEDYKIAPAISIQTSDGFQVQVDVSMLYRVVDPYVVLTKVGEGRLFEINIVMRRSDKIFRQTLGSLKAEDFFNDDKRMQAAEFARKELTEDLKDWGIEVWGVLIRDYTYDSRYQNQIEAKKIEDQRLLTNEANTKRETREAEKSRRVAGLQRTIEELRGQGDLEIRKIKADGELYSRKQVAEGDRAFALAEADATKLERQALEQSGAANIVGLEMAEAMKGTEVIIISTTGKSGVNPLDLDSLIGGW